MPNAIVSLPLFVMRINLCVLFSPQQELSPFPVLQLNDEIDFQFDFLAIEIFWHCFIEPIFLDQLTGAEGAHMTNDSELPEALRIEIYAALRGQRRRLEQVALSEGAPVDVLGDKLARWAERSDINVESGMARAGQLVAYAENVIQTMLEEAGFTPVRHKEGHIPPLAGTFQKTIYVRPAEEMLFDAIDGGASVIVATSSESKRYAKAVIRRYGSSGRGRPVFVWTSGSGLFQVFGCPPQAEYRKIPGGVALRYLSAQVDKLFGDDAPTLRSALSARGMAHLVARFDGQEIASWIGLGSEPEVFVECIVDDLDADGEPLQVLPEILQEIGSAAVSNFIQNGPAQFDVRLGEVSNDQRPEVFGKIIQLITERRQTNALYLLHDSNRYLSEAEGGLAFLTAMNAAVVNDASTRLRRAGTGTQIVLLGTEFSLPSELAGELTVVDLPLPGRRELLRELRHRLGNTLAAWAQANGEPEPETLCVSDDLLRLVDAAAGMTLVDVSTAIRRSDMRFGNDVAPSVDDVLESINREKRSAVKRSPALELVQLKGIWPPSLGGMEEFTKWLARRRKAFDKPDKAQLAGIDRPPRGVLLLGIPGTGKSLAAKVIASEWSMPLVRLDMGALQNKWVGASEERVRAALSIVEAMSPCVLWIDEIDKGVSQAESHGSNSTDLNIRATLLTWMQESRAPVFTVATANRFENLPPELTRAGRFDARFFFGCPDPDGRCEILDIHMRARGLDTNELTSSQRSRIIAAMHGFTGSEIEQVVLDALYAAFDEERAVTAKDLLQAAQGTKPIVRAVGKGLEEAWALIEQGRVQLASRRFLTRGQLLMLIDPTLYSPMYCRKEHIHGWDTHTLRAEKMLMALPSSGGVAAVLDAGDPAWLFAQTNIRYDLNDVADFKFLDTFASVESNGVFDKLMIDYGIDRIIFENVALLDAFKKSEMLAQYVDYFHLAPSAGSLKPDQE